MVIRVHRQFQIFSESQRSPDAFIRVRHFISADHRGAIDILFVVAIDRDFLPQHIPVQPSFLIKFGEFFRIFRFCIPSGDGFNGSDAVPACGNFDFILSDIFEGKGISAFLGQRLPLIRSNRQGRISFFCAIYYLFIRNRIPVFILIQPLIQGKRHGRQVIGRIIGRQIRPFLPHQRGGFPADRVGERPPFFQGILAQIPFLFVLGGSQPDYTSIFNRMIKRILRRSQLLSTHAVFGNLIPQGFAVHLRPLNGVIDDFIAELIVFGQIREGRRPVGGEFSVLLSPQIVFLIFRKDCGFRLCGLMLQLIQIQIKIRPFVVSVSIIVLPELFPAHVLDPDQAVFHRNRLNVPVVQCSDFILRSHFHPIFAVQLIQSGIVLLKLFCRQFPVGSVLFHYPGFAHLIVDRVPVDIVFGNLCKRILFFCFLGCFEIDREDRSAIAVAAFDGNRQVRDIDGIASAHLMGHLIICRAGGAEVQIKDQLRDTLTALFQRIQFVPDQHPLISFSIPPGFGHVDRDLPQTPIGYGKDRAIAHILRYGPLIGGFVFVIGSIKLMDRVPNSLPGVRIDGRHRFSFRMFISGGLIPHLCFHDIDFIRFIIPDSYQLVPASSVFGAQRYGIDRLRLLLVKCVYIQCHIFPVGHIAAVRPVLLNDDRMPFSRAVCDCREISPVFRAFRFVYRIKTHVSTADFQQKVLIEQPFFVIFGQPDDRNIPRFCFPHRNGISLLILRLCGSVLRYSVHLESKAGLGIVRFFSADRAIEGESNLCPRLFQADIFPLFIQPDLFCFILNGVCDSIGNDGIACFQIFCGFGTIGYLFPVLNQGKCAVFLQKIVRVIPLVYGALHPAVLQLFALSPVFGRIYRTAVGHVLRIKFIHGHRNIGIIPRCSLRTVFLAGLEGQFHRYLLKSCLKSSRIPGLDNGAAHCSGKPVGNRSPVINEIVSAHSSVEDWRQFSVCTDFIDEIAYGAVYTDFSEYLLISGTCHHFPHHINIFIPFRVVLRKIDVLSCIILKFDFERIFCRACRSRYKDHIFAVGVRHRRRGTRIGSHPISPQMEFYIRAGVFIRCRFVQPYLGRFIGLRPGKGQDQFSAAVQRIGKVSHNGRIGIVEADGKIVLTQCSQFQPVRILILLSGFQPVRYRRSVIVIFGQAIDRNGSPVGIIRIRAGSRVDIRQRFDRF